MKRLISLFLAICLFLFPIRELRAWSSFRNETGMTNANMTAAKTPTVPETAGVKWQHSFADETPTCYNSDPVITDNDIYIVSRDILYRMDKEGNILNTLALVGTMNSVCRMTLSGNRLCIPLSGGRIQCIDTDTWSSVWISEAFGLQSLTTTYCLDGLVYAGTTNANATDGMYYCLDLTDGSTVWTYRNEENPCGYYWSGAASCGAKYLLFGGDDGNLVSHSRTDDTVYDTFCLSTLTSSHGKIRAGITYDTGTDAYYTTTNDGYLYRIEMNPDGTFRSVIPRKLCEASGQGSDTGSQNTVNCTSTPTIYRNRIYVCGYQGKAGAVWVIDSHTMSLLYTATSPDIHDIKSSPLVCTGYATKENHYRVFVYFTQNFTPGGIYYIEDDETSTSAQIKTLFTPVTHPQFCLSSIAADTDGTLYYSNDSGAFFAVQDGYPAEETPSPQIPSPSPFEGAPSPTPSKEAPSPAEPNSATPGANIRSTAFRTDTPSSDKPNFGQKPGKPTRIKCRVKKKKNKRYRITLSWKKGKNSQYTEIRIKGRKTLRLRGTKKQITLTKGTWTIRFYGIANRSVPNTKSGAARLKLRLR